ncbi:hypothetical protein L7E55_11625, partial [Pelotomaculum isophthalicicum JI]
KFLPKTLQEWNTTTRTMLFVFKERFIQIHFWITRIDNVMAKKYHPFRLLGDFENIKGFLVFS